MLRKTLTVDAKITDFGISIELLGKSFEIEYPKGIWEMVPSKEKQVLLENITFANTHYLPLFLGGNKISYNTRFPLLESYFFRNQVCDLMDCETADDKPHLSYVKKLYNLDYEFREGPSTAPDETCVVREKNESQDVAILPFTFGKESLASFAMCLELGIKPVLVYCEEPVQPFESEYKLKRLEEIRKKYGVPVYHIKNGAGLFRYGKAFPNVERTEVGWGSQTTILAMMMIPFVYAHGAKYIFFGSEYANNEYEMKRGWKVFHSYDQTTFWTNQQDSIVQILTLDSCRVRSTFEPIDEPNIFYMLHHRYPELSGYHFSCFAENSLVGDSQWCHNCYKCSRMFILAKACGIDPARIGFVEDILQKEGMFDHYLGSKYATGSAFDLDFAFYSAMKKGVKSPYIEKFEKLRMPEMKPWDWHIDYFTKLKPNYNLPEKYRDGIIKIFEDELSAQIYGPVPWPRPHHRAQPWPGPARPGADAAAGTGRQGPHHL